MSTATQNDDDVHETDVRPYWSIFTDACQLAPLNSLASPKRFTAMQNEDEGHDIDDELCAPREIGFHGLPKLFPACHCQEVPPESIAVQVLIELHEIEFNSPPISWGVFQEDPLKLITSPELSPATQKVFEIHDTELNPLASAVSADDHVPELKVEIVELPASAAMQNDAEMQETEP